MSIQYIRDHYGVPAKLGGLIQYRNGRTMKITGARGSYLIVREVHHDSASAPSKILGRKMLLHPTCEVRYLNADNTRANSADGEENQT